MKGEERLVCHFYRTSNWPCKVRAHAACATHAAPRPALLHTQRVVRLRTTPLSLWPLRAASVNPAPLSPHPSLPHHQVMDKHLQELCQLHLETKFVRIDAEKSPFLTERLKIWMLPTLALVKNEKVLDYVVGFDDLGGKDDFTTVRGWHSVLPPDSRALVSRARAFAPSAGAAAHAPGRGGGDQLRRQWRGSGGQGQGCAAKGAALLQRRRRRR